MPKDAEVSSSLKNFKTRAFKFFKRPRSNFLIKLHGALEDQAMLERLPRAKMINGEL